MIRYFASHPTAANLLMLLLVVIGLVAAPTLRRETFPDFTAQEVEVRIAYPGASAEDVEEAICLRVEDALDAISEVDEVRCQALEGMGISVARMREGGDLGRFLDDVRTEVDAIDEFPEQVEPAVISQLGRTDQVVTIAVTGPMSVSDLKAYAEQLKRRLQGLGPVSQVRIQGFSERQLQVQVPQRALVQYGLSVSDMADAIARQSVDLPAGTLQTRDRELLLRFTDLRRTPRELEDLLVVGGASGAEVRLGDIASVEDRFALDEDKTLFNGERAAMLQITKTKDEDALVVIEAVRAFLERERQRAAPGVRLVLTEDVSSIVRDRLQLLVRNGLQGLALVFLVMWLFFQLRFAFWVAMGLPVSFLGALFFMSAIGYSLNLITMVALLIALGLLMDDAIVISENIATHVRKGKQALAAAIDGTREVLPGVVSSFLTTVAVFGPLAFLSGDMGKVLGVLPVVLILVLSVSLLEAFLILPHHLAHALGRGGGHENRLRARFNAVLEGLRAQVLGRGVDAVIRARYLFAGVVVALFLVSAGMLAGGQVKFRAFPDIEGDVVEARILLPQGIPLWRTEAAVGHLIAALGRVDDERSPLQPDGQRLVRTIAVRFNHNPDAHETGPHVATVIADLLTAQQRRGGLDELITRWREEAGEIPDVIGLSFKEPRIGPAGLAIDIRLQGPDLAELKAASLALQGWLRRYRGVSNLTDDLRPGKPELRLRLREGTLALGLSAADIAGQLRAGFYGTTASEIQVGPESYAVEVRLADRDRSNLARLEEFRIITPDGAQIPLATIAALKPGRGFARIHRIDGARTVTLQGDVDTRIANASEIIHDTRMRFLPELAERHPTVAVSLEGESKESAKTGASLRRGFLIGLVGIFILLSFQFRSYAEPLVVMAAIPLAFIGVIWGHLIMGLELSMPSIMGFASLAGIVVNDAILLVEVLKRRAREGHPIAQAAGLASRERFRAVALTSLTTIAGLLPRNRSPPLEILTENQYRIHSADACQLAQLIRIGWGTGSL
jgi:multidrug efflux pump subunit AcrB